MDIVYFRSIEGVLVVNEDFEVVYFMLDVCFYLCGGMSYEEWESGQWDKIFFEGNIIIVVLKEVV